MSKRKANAIAADGEAAAARDADADCDALLPTQGEVIPVLTTPVKAAALLARIGDDETQSVTGVLQQAFYEQGDSLQDLIFETARLLAEIQARTGWNDLDIIRAVGCREEINQHTSKTVDEAKLRLLIEHLQALLVVAEDAFDTCGDVAVVRQALSAPEVRKAVRNLNIENALNELRFQPELLLHQHLG